MGLGLVRVGLAWWIHSDIMHVVHFRGLRWGDYWMGVRGLEVDKEMMGFGLVSTIWIWVRQHNRNHAFFVQSCLFRSVPAA